MSPENKEKILTDSIVENIEPKEDVEPKQEEVKQSKKTETTDEYTVISVKQTFVVLKDKNGKLKSIDRVAGSLKIGDRISIWRFTQNNH